MGCKDEDVTWGGAQTWTLVDGRVGCGSRPVEYRGGELESDGRWIQRMEDSITGKAAKEQRRRDNGGWPTQEVVEGGSRKNKMEGSTLVGRNAIWRLNWRRWSCTIGQHLSRRSGCFSGSSASYSSGGGGL